MKTQNRTAIYIRVSTQDQAREGYSIDEQRERLTKYCDAHGWTIHKVYSDPGFSGGSLNRPGMQELIRDVGKHRVDRVIVYKLDRLSRSQRDILYMIDDVFIANNVDFVSMTENFDTGTPMGKAMIGIMAVFAQLEREQIKERMSIGKEGRAKSGLFCGSARIPIGYRYIDGKLIPDPYEAMIVKRIFSEYASGKSIYRIASDLKAEGVMSSYGSIGRNTIQSMVRNETYLGIVKYNTKRFDGQHEAIVDRETFDIVQRIVAANKAKVAGYNFNSLTSPIGSLCYCGYCNHKMRIFSAAPRKSDGVRHKYIACDNAYRKEGCTTKARRLEKFEAEIMEVIGQLRIDPAYLDQCRSDREIDDQQIQINALTAKIKDNRQKIDRLMDLYTVGGIDLDSVGERIQMLNNEIVTAQINVENLMQDVEDSMTDENIIETVEQLFADDLCNEDRRSLLASLIRRIEFSGETVQIFWAF